VNSRRLWAVKTLLIRGLAAEVPPIDDGGNGVIVDKIESVRDERQSMLRHIRQSNASSLKCLARFRFSQHYILGLSRSRLPSSETDRLGSEGH
jgi:hypothetical protein